MNDKPAEPVAKTGRRERLALPRHKVGVEAAHRHGVKGSAQGRHDGVPHLRARLALCILKPAVYLVARPKPAHVAAPGSAIQH